MNYQKAKFLLSVANLHQLPPDEGIEIAFVGRSNAGKSSVLNQLTQNKSLARVSKTPGRTQHINLFGVTDDFRMADLPGYGYAKVTKAIKEHWQNVLDEYFQIRECLNGLVLIMDIRHPLKEFDEQLLLWSQHAQIPVHILLNKADKLSYSQQKQTLFKVTKELEKYDSNVSLQLFSALKGQGLDELKKKLDEWLSPNTPTL